MPANPSPGRRYRHVMRHATDAAIADINKARALRPGCVRKVGAPYCAAVAGQTLLTKGGRV
jgi:hypothetical protein